MGILQMSEMCAHIGWKASSISMLRQMKTVVIVEIAAAFAATVASKHRAGAEQAHDTSLKETNSAC